MIEIPQKRTANSKHFQKEDGIFEAHISASDIHYIDENLTYQDIECKLFDEFDFVNINTSPSLEGRERFYIKKGELFLDKKTRDDHDFQALKVPFECVLPRKFKRGYSIGKRNDKLKFIPVGANNVIGETQGDTIHFIDGWTDTDITLQVKNNGIKETIILKSASSPKLFSFEVSGNLADDLTAGELHLEYAWLKDANGTHRDILQTIRREDTKTFIDLTVDVSNLVYPVLIDPTVTVQNSSVTGKNADAMEYSPTTTQSTWPINGGTEAASLSRNRSFFQFDISSIPLGSTVSNAILKLYYLQHAQYGTFNVSIKRVTAPWDQTLTWNNQPTFDNSSFPTVSIPGSSAGSKIDWNITSFMSGWMNGTFSNYGMVCVGDEAQQGSKKTFMSWKDGNGNGPEKYPTIVVTYNMAPTTPIVTAPNGGETWNAQHTITWASATDLTDKKYDFNIASRDSTEFLSDLYDQGQTFLTGNKPETLRVVRVAMNSTISPGTPLYVSLFNTDGTVPTTEIIKITVTSGGGGSNPIIEVIFPDNALTANTRYAIVLNNPPGASLQVYRVNSDINANGTRVFKWSTDPWQTHATELAMEIQTTTEKIFSSLTVINGSNFRALPYRGVRKFIRMSDGTFVLALFNSTTSQYNFYKSSNDGLTWNYINLIANAPNIGGISIVPITTTLIGVLHSVSDATPQGVRFKTLDISTGVISAGVTLLSSSPNFIYEVSLAISNGIIHAIWSAKNNANSYNLYYSKSSNNGSTWDTVTQLTSLDSVGNNYTVPVITCKNDGNPIFVCSTNVILGGGTSNYVIYSCTWNGTSWGPFVHVGGQSAASQSYPSIAVAPNGRIWCAWSGNDTTDTGVNNIRIKYSDDGGATWVNGGISGEKLTFGNINAEQMPSITINSSGKVFVVWLGKKSSGVLGIKMSSYDGSSWSSVTVISPEDSTFAEEAETLMDNTLDFSVPYTLWRYNGQSLVLSKENILQYHIQISSDNGVSWSDILPPSPFKVTSYLYDFTPVPSSTQTKIRIRAYNGESYSPYDESNAVFTIQHNQLSDSTITSPVHNIGYLVGLRPRISIASTDPDANTLTDIHIQIGSNAIFNTGVIVDTTSGVSATGWTFTTIPSGGSTFYTPQIDLGYGVRYIRVRTYDGTAWGNWSQTVQVNFVNPNWSNPNIGDEDSGIRKVWIDELRTHINNVRLARGLVAFNFTDPTLTADVTNVRVQHIVDLRNSISAVHTTIGLTSPVWADPTITANVTNRRGIHIKQLRTAAQSG